MLRPILALAFAGLFSPLASAQTETAPTLSWRGNQWQVAPVNLRLRVDYQNTIMGREEGSLALLGTHLDFENISGRVGGLWAGVGTYSATDGDVGGLSTLGLNLGWRHQFDGGWSFEAGNYVGIGGGGGAPVGDSLMTRTFLGMEYVLSDRLGFRVEKARVNFTNADITGDDWTAGLSWRMRPWLARPGRAKTAALSPAAGGRLRGGIDYFSHNPNAQSRRTDGSRLTGNLAGFGVRTDMHLSGNWFGSSTAHAATIGNASGFHQFLIGVGHENSWGGGALETRIMVGSGGGGGIDTGGGLLWQPSIGYRSSIGRDSSWSIGLGKTIGSTSDFSATTFMANIAFGLPAIGFGRHDHGRALPSTIKLSSWAVAPLARFMASGPDYQLAGIKIIKPIQNGWEFDGSVLSAANGLEGGYSEGWLGTRYRVAPSIDSRFSLLPGVAIGIGGGSGVDVGSGGLINFSLASAWEYSPGTELQFSLGKVDALRGTFAETYAQLAWVWHFGVPSR